MRIQKGEPKTKKVTRVIKSEYSRKNIIIFGWAVKRFNSNKFTLSSYQIGSETFLRLNYKTVIEFFRFRQQKSLLLYIIGY